MASDFRPARAEEIESTLGPPGFIGPVGARLPVLKDAAIQGEGYFAGANKPDAHLIGVVPGRDFPFEELDIRSVEAGDIAPGGHPIEIEPAIEVGQIFKLGTRYSEPLGANYLDERGQASTRSSWAATGSARRARSRRRSSRAPTSAASSGRAAIAPWDIHLVGLGKDGDEATEVADRLHAQLRQTVRVVYDDRDAGPGEKLTDAELLGCPLRITVGRRALAAGAVEAQARRSGAEQRCRSPRRPRARSSCSMASTEDDRSGRRLVGLDRSGPKPRATRRGQPLRPLTIPNLVGYLRLAGIPVFLYLALGSDDGQTAATSILFLAISAADYLDGFLARATGQYSRMGALLDPLVDRLTVLAGVVVTWKFELLPRWALAVLALREIVTLMLAQLALRRGVDLEINWVGRWSVWLTMGGIFLALATDAWIGPAMFLVGLAGSLLASALYLKAGLARPARAGTELSGVVSSCSPQPQLDLSLTRL